MNLAKRGDAGGWPWGPRAGRSTLLVIDDNPAMRDLLRAMLEDTYEIMTAGTGEAGLQMVAARGPDLVLLDLVMPGIDGFEVLQRLSGSPAAPKVVVVTALNYASTAVTALQLGALDYLTKPFDQDAVRATVERALGCPPARVILVGDELGARAALTAALGLTCGVPVVALPPSQGGAERRDRSVVVVDLSGEVGRDTLTSVFRAVAPRRAFSAPTLDLIRHVAAHLPFVTVGGVTHALKVSPQRLSTVVRTELGVTPKSYITRARLEAAKCLLGQGETLETIAERVGFCDSAHFSRVFTRQTGTAPGRYRRHAAV